MRCDEIQERFIDLLYSERGTASASQELRAHIDSCASCRKVLEDMKGVKSLLSLWKDEIPLRSVSIPAAERRFHAQGRLVLHYLRYAAVAAALILAFLALANAEITWQKGEFSFRTHFLPAAASSSNYYTKAEVRDLMKRALDDSEAQLLETNRLMILRVMDTLEQDQARDLQMIRGMRFQHQTKN